MDKFILICLSLFITVLIAAGCSAQRHLSWENGYLVVDGEIQPDPLRPEIPNLIRLDFDDKNIIVRLDNNKTARSMIAHLPDELAFQDYSDVGQMSILDGELAADELQGMTPQRGDVCYYKPWNSIILFDRDGQFTHGLTKIGTVQEGASYISDLAGRSVYAEMTD